MKISYSRQKPSVMARSWFAILLFAGVTTVFSLSNVHADTARIHVATTGNDQASGTGESPLKSVDEAVKRLEALDKRNLKMVEVIFKGGTYPLDKAVTIGPKASGTDTCKVVFRAEGKEPAHLTGARAIENWKPLSGDTPYVRSEDKGKIWVADIPKGWLFHYLYAGEDSLPVAKLHNAEAWHKWPRIGRSVKPTGPEGQLLRFPKGTLDVLKGKDGMVEMNILPVQFWNSISVLRGINPETNTAYRHSKSPTTNSKQGFDNGNYNLLNDLSFIDRPGEWAVDSKEGKVYLWPTKEISLNKTRLTAPAPYRLLSIVGDESAGKLVKNVHFRGLTFSCTDRLPEDEWPDHWVKRQAELPDGMLFFQDVEGCSVTDCTLLRSGSYSLAFNQYAQNNLVSRNELGFSGCGGVLLQGYGPGTKDVNKNNTVTRNYIHDVARGAFMHSAAITFYQSGVNKITYNILENLPYCAVAVIGAGWKDFNPTVKRGGMGAKNWYDSYGSMEAMYKARYHELPKYEDQPEAFTRDGFKQFLHSRNNNISNNIIINYMSELGDGGGLYAWGCGKGNVFENNLLQKPKHKKGQHLVIIIYMDDHVDHAVVKGNIAWADFLYRAIYTKGKNQLENNVHSFPSKPAGFDDLLENIVAGAEREGGWKENVTPTFQEPKPVAQLIGIQAESYTKKSGTKHENSYYGEHLGYIGNENWIMFEEMEFPEGITTFTARASCGNKDGGTIDLRLGSASGELIGSCRVKPTGDWGNWSKYSGKVNGLSGKQDLYLVFTGKTNSASLFNIDGFEFDKKVEWKK